MTTTPATLVARADLPIATTTVYTSPTSGKGSRIDYAEATNYSGAAKTINVYLVPFGGAAANSNLVIQAASLAAGEARVLFELLGARLAPGDVIAWSASSATSVNGAITGVELT